MNIDISNAHCGPRIQFPDHAWLRVVLIPKNCLRFCVRANVGRSPGRARRRRSTVRLPWASSEMNREVFAEVVAAARSRTRSACVSRSCASPDAKGDRSREPTACLPHEKLVSRETGEDRHASSCTRRLLVRDLDKHHSPRERSTTPRRGRLVSSVFFFFFS